MLASIRRRLCYANVVATFALVFAMSGGALAAGHYLLTSTGQVSPKVLKALKGKSGPAGAPGPQGAQGAQGPKGEAGAPGARGETGAKGETGATGAAGVTGARQRAGATGAPGGPALTGSPWTAGGTLPSGQSETGTWASSGPAGEYKVEAPRWRPSRSHLTVAPTAQRDRPMKKAQREANENLPAGCEGNVEAPKADPGNLCVFEYFNVENATVKAQVVSAVGAHRDRPAPRPPKKALRRRGPGQ